MRQKPKFKPQIFRVKLNPEQAVLTCRCYDRVGYTYEGGGYHRTDYEPDYMCSGYSKGRTTWCKWPAGPTPDPSRKTVYMRADGSTLS